MRWDSRPILGVAQHNNRFYSQGRVTSAYESEGLRGHKFEDI